MNDSIPHTDPQIFVHSSFVHENSAEDDDFQHNFSCISLSSALPSFKSLSITNNPRHLRRRYSLKSLFKKRSRLLILDPLDETRPGRPLPNLPPELWVMIIRESAGSLDYGHGKVREGDKYISDPSVTIPLLTRAEYVASISQKLACSLVSKRWNAYTAEVLYEYIWLSRARQAKALALTLLCQVCASPVINPSIYSTNITSANPFCSPFSSSSGPKYTHYPTPSNIPKALQSPASATKSNQPGRHIRVLHLETPTLDRCDPLDVRTILDYAPNLLAFCDFKSIRRNLVEEVRDPRGSVEGLLRALGAARTSGEPSLLRRLSWTCYSSDFIMMSSLCISSIVEHLQFLEMDFSCADGRSFLDTPFAATTSMVSSITTTTTTDSLFGSSVTSTTTVSSSPTLCDNQPERSTSNTGMIIANIVFPVLKGLTMTLPEITLEMVSSWMMPKLTTLTLSLTDSTGHFTLPSLQGKANPFHRFFQAHGTKLAQLELCSHVEPSSTEELILAELCPNLKSFICNGPTNEDVDWNWEDPDWVVPHPLLTGHENLEFIGIRGMGDLVRRTWLNASPTHTSPDYSAYVFSSDPSPYFMVLEQLSSLLMKDNFPNLKFIRDLSEDSDLLRRGIRQVAPYALEYKSQRFFATPSHTQETMVPGHARVVSFWKEFLGRAGDRGIYVEDCVGVNVTRRDLERWGAGLE